MIKIENKNISTKIEVSGADSVSYIDFCFIDNQRVILDLTLNSYTSVDGRYWFTFTKTEIDTLIELLKNQSEKLNGGGDC